MQSKITIIANWKMHPEKEKDALILLKEVKKLLPKKHFFDVIIAPPAIYLPSLQKHTKNKIELAGQTMHAKDAGAYTGSLSAKMLKQYGASYVILGHSETRATGETNNDVNEKIKSALKVGLIPIVCIGESVRDESHQYLAWLQTEIKETFSGLPAQALGKIFIAYEPLWAIGENATREATPEECREIVIYIKRVLTDMYGAKSTSKIKILYGGSVDESNARMMLEEGGVQGLLVGRVSLKPKQFIKLIEATAFYNENNKTNW